MMLFILMVMAAAVFVGTLQLALDGVFPWTDPMEWFIVCAFYTVGFGLTAYFVPLIFS